MFTPRDLEKARLDLQRWNDRAARADAEKPGKYESDVRAARERVAMIESYLGRIGVEVPAAASGPGGR